MALLSGARNKKDGRLSEETYLRIQKCFPELKGRLISASILLSNVYASIGEIEKSLNIKNQLHQINPNRKVGISWTVINGQVFVSDLRG